MLTDQIVALLIAERDKLNRAIEALSGPAKRRGRPPKDTAPQSGSAPLTRKKRSFSPEQREAARQRMKAMWAKRKKAAKKAG